MLINRHPINYHIQNVNLGSGMNLGVCKRKASCGELVCYASDCDFENKELDKIQIHIQV